MTTAVSRPFASVLRAPLFCALLALTLAACGQSQPERGLAADPDAAAIGQFVAGRTLSAPVSAAAPKDDTAGLSVLVPPSPAVRNGRVTEKQYLNGWRQSMSLDKGKEGGDWNDLVLEIQTAPGAGGRGEITLAKPTQEGVRREILARFPGMPMRVVTRPMQNALGSYGLAVGAGAGGLRCAYAWQWVENLQAAAAGQKGVSFFGGGEGAASIRMRLCRRGVTADELAQWYAQIAVSPENLARVAEAMRRNQGVMETAAAGSGALGPVVGGRGATVPVDSLESSLIGAAPAAGARPPRRAARQAVRRAAPAAAAPEPAGLPPSSYDGPRYLGPVSGAGGPQYAADAAPRGAGFGRVVDGGLPPQAFRGPAGARAITQPY